jgi:hypothetical protein
MNTKMDDLIEEVEYKGFRIEIYPCDNFGESSRDWDNLGTMACFHKRYDLGDKTELKSSDFNGWDELAAYLEKQGAAVIMPLYLYDHSGITISCGNSYPYNDRWDAGQVGFIYVTKEKIRKEYGVKRVSKELLETVREVLVNEVKTYDQDLRGDVYSFVSYKGDEEIDSCGGLYGVEYAVQYAKDEIDAHIKWLAKEEEELVKDMQVKGEDLKVDM